MAIRKLATLKSFDIPDEHYPPDYDEKGNKITRHLTVKMATAGARRNINTYFYDNGVTGILTYQLVQLWAAFEECDIQGQDPVRNDIGEVVYDENGEVAYQAPQPMFKKNMTVNEFTQVCDTLSPGFIAWMLEKVYELNPDWDVNAPNPTKESSAQ